MKPQLQPVAPPEKENWLVYTRHMAEDYVVPVDATVPPVVTFKVLKQANIAMEIRMIAYALKHTNGNKRKAAKVLGISMSGLSNKFVRYGLAALLCLTLAAPLFAALSDAEALKKAVALFGRGATIGTHRDDDDANWTKWIGVKDPNCATGARWLANGFNTYDAAFVNVDLMPRLAWDINKEADLAGYHVYRSETGGPPTDQYWTRVNCAMIPMPAWTDGTADLSKPYAYHVRAVNKSGWESAPSKEVWVFAKLNAARAK